MHLPPAPLEDWMRAHYFDAPIDLGSSGVEPFTFREVRELLRIDGDELDRIDFHDSHTLGADALRQAIADRWGTGQPEMVMATAGSNEALFLLTHALVEPGDCVLALDPCYQQLYGSAEAMGCRIVRWPLRGDAFVADLADLDALAPAPIRLVVLNFPTNPTGTMLSPEDCRRVNEWCASRGAWVIWDMAFADLVEEPRVAVADLLQYERAIAIGTLSKSYGLPGLRVGWAIGQPGVWSPCIRMRDYTTLHLSPLVEFVAERAIRHADVLLAPRLDAVRANRRGLEEWLNARQGSVQCSRPGGGVCAFPRFVDVRDTTSLCEAAARQGVLLVPGACFGHPSHVRLGFGAAPDTFRAGLARLSHVLASDGAPIASPTISSVAMRRGR